VKSKYGVFSGGLKVGDRVEILQSKHISGLRHRKQPCYGYITHVDGAYIDVRPTWTRRIIEFYPNELIRR